MLPPSCPHSPGRTPQSPAGCHGCSCTLSACPVPRDTGTAPRHFLSASPAAREPMRVTPSLCRSPRETVHRQEPLCGVEMRVAGAGQPPSPGRRSLLLGTRSLPTATGPQSRVVPQLPSLQGARPATHHVRPERSRGPTRAVGGRAEAGPHVLGRPPSAMNSGTQKAPLPSGPLPTGSVSTDPRRLSPRTASGRCAGARGSRACALVGTEGRRWRLTGGGRVL